MAVLNSTGLAAEALVLEITETVLLDAAPHVITDVRKLRAEGIAIAIAIDDFGTGYASLTYLRDLPASAIKIDSSFVQGIPRDHDAVSIVAGVIGLARNFGLSCIAEGIETQEQLDYLSDRGVLGQGFLLGRPSGGDVISVLIERDLARPRVVAAPA